MYCSYCKQKTNVVSGLYGKSEFIACEKCGDTTGSEEQQSFTESMLEALSYETLNLEVFVPLNHVPQKFKPLYPKRIPMLETADVANVDIVPALFQPYAQFVSFESLFSQQHFTISSFFTLDP